MKENADRSAENSRQTASYWFNKFALLLLGVCALLTVAEMIYSSEMYLKGNLTWSQNPFTEKKLKVLPP